MGMQNRKSHLSRVIHFHKMPLKFRSLEFRDWVARFKQAFWQIQSSKADAGYCLQVSLLQATACSYSYFFELDL